MSKIGKKFIEQTKYQQLERSDQEVGLPQPPFEVDYDTDKEVIDLPKPEDINTKEINLRNAIERRESLRRYSDQPLSLKELSFLLWTTQGVKEMTDNATLRTVPSAGARHAFETYLLINNIEDLNPGLYRFLAIDHQLIEMNLESNIADRVTAACLGQRFVKTSAVTFIWTAVPYRMTWRYSQRGYRYLHLDAGHVCQNLYLSAEAIDSGVCAIAAFADDNLNNLLKIDGKEQFVIYAAAIGKKE